MRKCPFCAEKIRKEAIKCRFCGEAVEPIATAETPDQQSNETDPLVTSGFLVGLGLICFLGGLIAVLYFYQQFDTTVPIPGVEILGETFGGGRVHNIGLMQERQNGLIVSSIGSVAGLILVALGQRLRQSEPSVGDRVPTIE